MSTLTNIPGSTATISGSLPVSHRSESLLLPSTIQPKLIHLPKVHVRPRLCIGIGTGAYFSIGARPESLVSDGFGPEVGAGPRL